MELNIEAFIFPIYQEKEKNNSMLQEFIVEVDDPIGYYLESLLNIIEKYNNRGVNLKTANKIEYNDCIKFTKNDIILLNRNYNCNKIYSLVNDYNKIVELIKNLYKKNSTDNSYKNCPYYKNNKKSTTENIFFDGVFINKNEKVSIFNNFVKIGYNTFDIYTHHNRDFVEINNNIYEIISNDLFFEKSKKESFCSKVKKKYLKLYQ
jgi:hypothetical protein